MKIRSFFVSAKLQKNHGLHLGRGIPIPSVNKKIPAARLKIIPSKDIFLTAKDIKKNKRKTDFWRNCPTVCQNNGTFTLTNCKLLLLNHLYTHVIRH